MSYVVHAIFQITFIRDIHYSATLVFLLNGMNYTGNIKHQYDN